MGRMFITGVSAVLLFAAGAAAQLESPRPDVYDMSNVRGDWFYSSEAAEQGRDLWVLPGSGSLALFTQCEIRLAPLDAFTPDEFADYVMGMSDDEYQQLMSGSMLNITAMSERELVDADGLPAVKHTIESALNDAPISWLHLFTYRAGHLVTTMCGTPSDGFEEVRPELEDFIDQIEYASGG
jgi:hypothetical protein